MTTTARRFVSTGQAAELLGCSITTARKIARERHISTLILPSGRIKFDVRDLERYLEAASRPARGDDSPPAGG